MSLISILLHFYSKRKKRKAIQNHYIKKHLEFLEDENVYLEYLLWCKENDFIPMDEKGFKEIRKKNKDFRDIM